MFCLLTSGHGDVDMCLFAFCAIGHLSAESIFMFKFTQLIVISSAATLLMIGVGMVVAILPQKILAMSGSLQSVGYLASFFGVSYLIIQLPVGRLADRFGTKLFLILGYILCGISGVVFIYAQTPEIVFLARFLQGAGEAPIWALGPALLSIAYPHSKGKAIGMYNAAIHAGLAIGPLVGILYYTKPMSSSPFLLFTITCFFGALILVVFLPKGAKSPYPIISDTASIADLAKLFSFKEPLLALLGIVLYGAGYGIFISVLPAYLTISRGFDGFDNGVFFTLFYISISVSQLVVGSYSDRYGRQVFMIFGLGMAAAGFAVFNLFTLPLIYLPLMFASAGLGVFCVSSIAYLNECVSSSLKSTISGAYYLAWGTGYFIGPLAIGWVGLDIGFYALAVLMAIQVAIFWFTNKGNN